MFSSILLQDYSGDIMPTIGFVPMLIWLAVVVVIIIAEWKIFTKAGKPGWAILIPIYNVIVFLEIIGKPWWWIFLFLIPIVNIIFLIIALNGLSKSFGYGVGFTLGLLFLSPIFVLILGFGDAKYIGPQA